MNSEFIKTPIKLRTKPSNKSSPKSSMVTSLSDLSQISNITNVSNSTFSRFSSSTRLPNVKRQILTSTNSYVSPLLSKCLTPVISKENSLFHVNTLPRSSEVTLPKGMKFKSDYSPSKTDQIIHYVHIDSIANFYKSKGILKLFPWQVECLEKSEVLAGKRNFVYSAPTSAGKTLVSEMLMVHRYCQTQRKTIYIVPYVSLGNEKAKYFAELFASTRNVVCGFFQSRPIHTNFDIAVCTIEKANALVNKMIQDKTFQKVGMIVVDEIHMLADKSRGYILETLLSKVMYVGGHIQVIGMSATVPDIHVIGMWLKAETYVCTYRPVELTENVVCENKVLSKSGEVLKTLCGGGEVNQIVELILEVSEGGKGVLCFCSSKYGCEKMGKDIVANLKKRKKGGFGLNEDIETLRELMVEELRTNVNGSDEELLKCVRCGLAYHHSGITQEEREILEKGFREGVLSLIIATSTLAVGVNLPASRVIFNRPYIGIDFLDVGRYRQMCGRAGRLGFDTKGESYLFVKVNEKKKVLEMVNAVLPPLQESVMENETSKMSQSILEGVEDKMIATEIDMEKYCRCSIYTVSDNPETVEYTQHNREIINNAIQILMGSLMVEESMNACGEKVYVTTQFGKATVNSGIGMDDALRVYSDLNEAKKKIHADSELQVLYLVSAINTSSEVDWDVFERKYEELNETDREIFNELKIDVMFVREMQSKKKTKEDVKLRKHQMAYCALVLNDLIKERDISEVTKEYNIARGHLQALQTNTAASANIIAQFCVQLGWDMMYAVFAAIVDRLNYGVRRELVDLTRIEGVKGRRARELYKWGLRSVDDVADATVDRVTDILQRMRRPVEKNGYVGGVMGQKVDAGVARKIIRNARELTGKLSAAEKVAVAIQSGVRNGIVRSASAMEQEMSIHYIGNVCHPEDEKSVERVIHLLREEREVGCFLKIIGEGESFVVGGVEYFKEEYVEGVAVGMLHEMYYIKYHKRCCGDCVLRKVIIPELIGNGERKWKLKMFNFKKNFGYLKEGAEVYDEDKVEDVLREYSAVLGNQVEVRGGEEVTIQDVAEGYMGQVGKLIPTVQIENLKEVRKIARSEIVDDCYINQIFEACNNCLLVVALSKVFQNELKKMIEEIKNKSNE
ncbi:DNA polymerase theta, putative [Entamoeba invadens IP1]|uniref:DNA polymerase theta, putative n=1 Tax=Entamoeba invadens IP1 TaxID=370355 RepID=A0A0A1TVK9_ENTIV|nr:DNA polymerase theta, putative [Entamoeba invadens IP1]ELP84457.1 DNA polymerase theta, putative [Entamoeba invadens IP1]|eukprot:XP_004183803.1 DNA polymerase theta, putative [Entamoeba invadens IP1]